MFYICNTNVLKKRCILYKTLNITTSQSESRLLLTSNIQPSFLNTTQQHVTIACTAKLQTDISVFPEARALKHNLQPSKEEDITR
jgi:hypothetical protein